MREERGGQMMASSGVKGFTLAFYAVGLMYVSDMRMSLKEHFGECREEES